MFRHQSVNALICSSSSSSQFLPCTWAASQSHTSALLERVESWEISECLPMVGGIKRDLLLAYLPLCTQVPVTSNQVKSMLWTSYQVPGSLSDNTVPKFYSVFLSNKVTELFSLLHPMKTYRQDDSILQTVMKTHAIRHILIPAKLLASWRHRGPSRPPPNSPWCKVGQAPNAGALLLLRNPPRSPQHHVFFKVSWADPHSVILNH